MSQAASYFDLLRETTSLLGPLFPGYIVSGFHVIPSDYSIFCLQFVHNNQPTLHQTVPPPVQQVNGNVNNQNVKTTLTGNSFTAIIKSLNIRIEAVWQHGFEMRTQLYVPLCVCERSYGHLGNCDGNPDNDVSIAGVNDRK